MMIRRLVYFCLFIFMTTASSIGIFSNTVLIDIVKRITKPLVYLDEMNITAAISSMRKAYTHWEFLLETYLLMDSENIIINKGCYIYLFHSFATEQFFNVSMLIIRETILTFIAAENISAVTYDLLNFIPRIFEVVGKAFMKNMALKSNDPFANAVYSLVRHNTINISISKLCQKQITPLITEFSGSFMTVSEEMTAKYYQDTVLTHLNKNLVSKKFAIARPVGGLILSRMVNLTSYADTTLTYFRVVDDLLLEMYRLITSPSILWTSTFSKYFSRLFHAATFLVSYGYVTLFVLGFVCNTLAMLLTASSITSTFNIYLFCLAVLDSCALVGNLLPTTVKYWLHYFATRECFTDGALHCLQPSYFADVYEISRLSCKIAHYVVAFCRAASAWLMVSSAFVRLMAVSRPLHWRHKSIAFHYRVVVATVLITASVTASPLLSRTLTVYRFRQYEIRYCHQQDIGLFTYEVELYCSSLIFPILPLCLISLFNAVTLYKMRATAKLLLQAKKHTHSRQSDTRSTVTLLTVSFTFVLLSSPYFINTLIQLYSKYDFHVARSALEYGTGPLLNLEQYFLTFVLSISNAINLFLYLLSSKYWRQRFVSYIWMKGCGRCGMRCNGMKNAIG